MTEPVIEEVQVVGCLTLLSKWIRNSLGSSFAARHRPTDSRTFGKWQNLQKIVIFFIL